MTENSFIKQATRELITDGTKLDVVGDAARDRARTWAILALAQATEQQALTNQTKDTP